MVNNDGTWTQHILADDPARPNALWIKNVNNAAPGTNILDLLIGTGAISLTALVAGLEAQLSFDGTSILWRVAGNSVIAAERVAGTNRIGFFAATPAIKQTVTGSRGGNAALASLLTALATLGLITDSTTA
jgi:hypothetical protein